MLLNTGTKAAGGRPNRKKKPIFFFGAACGQAIRSAHGQPAETQTDKQADYRFLKCWQSVSADTAMGKGVRAAWKKSRTILLMMKGDPESLNNYRPITLLSQIYKTFTRIILNRIVRDLDMVMSREQAGFRTPSPTRTSLMLMRQSGGGLMQPYATSSSSLMSSPKIPSKGSVPIIKNVFVFTDLGGDSEEANIIPVESALHNTFDGV
ncbi:hypothetical protein OSTOST_22517, partial [Ostertagia ostertagi]